jgi:2-phosphosulfolactate phosphatase
MRAIVSRRCNVTDVRVDVAFTPGEALNGSVAIVVDVLRATSTIVQALASGYRRVLCCAEVDEALALRDEVGGAVLAGERLAASIPGFDLGNSPRDFLEPRGETLILTTTNGTRAVIAAAARCDVVLIGSLLNLDAVAAAARARGEDVAVVCAGVEGERALDDAYCAGRIAELLDGERTQTADEALAISRSFSTAQKALEASANPRQRDLGEDIAWCARESIYAVVPTFAGTRGAAAEVVALT